MVGSDVGNSPAAPGKSGGGKKPRAGSPECHYLMLTDLPLKPFRPTCWLKIRLS